jgi:hypothetical protein
MTGEPDPPWMRDAARAVGHELAAFATTLWAILASPARFAADWASGRRHALNPLAFLFNSLAVVGPWRALWARLLDPNPPTTPLWFELGKPALPVLFSVAVTALFHLLLKPLGGRRPLRSSLAMAMYVSGGPMAILNFLVAPLVLYGFIHRDHAAVAVSSALANLVLLAFFFVYLIATQASLHKLPRWRVTVAALLAWSAFGVLSARMSLHHPELMRSLLEG